MKSVDVVERRGAAESVSVDWRRASNQRVRSAKTFRQLYFLLFHYYDSETFNARHGRLCFLYEYWQAQKLNIIEDVY